MVQETVSRGFQKDEARKEREHEARKGDGSTS